MKELKLDINKLLNSEINTKIEERLKEFESFKFRSSEEWFYELCFCILAANAKQKTSQLIQESLKNKLLTLTQEELSQYIKENKHRFHNNKAKYIVEARQYKNIREILKELPEHEARDFLVNNIMGIGMKESSHFLRNTGKKNLAILDRHIISTLIENKIIEKPKTLTKNNYLLIEEKFNNLAKALDISPAKLDLLMWYMKTGEVAK